MEFQQTCPKFLGKQTTYRPSMPGWGGFCVPTWPLEGQDQCWPAGLRACGMGAGCSCALPWHPPSLCPEAGAGWAVRGWLVPTVVWPVSLSSLLVPCPDGFWEAQVIPSFKSSPEAITFIPAAWSQRGLAQPWQLGKVMGNKSILGSVRRKCGTAVGTGMERTMVLTHFSSHPSPLPICSKDTFCMSTHTFGCQNDSCDALGWKGRVAGELMGQDSGQDGGALQVQFISRRWMSVQHRTQHRVGDLKQSMVK